MRARVTFRRRGRIATEPHPSQEGGWIGEYAGPGDKGLSRELREILQTARCLYALTTDDPPHKDVRATLQALASVGDGDAQNAVAAIDDSTRALLDEAALRVYRRSHAKPAPVPLGIFNWRSWTPEHVRALAKAALKSLPRLGGGRPRVLELHIQFARSVLSHWRRSHGRATLNRYAETPFHRFSADMFLRAGRPLSRDQLYRILLSARS